MVHPWRLDGELIGYIELGEEIMHITPRLKELLDVDLILVIDKQFTNRDKWMEGQRMMGHPGDWDEFPDVVVIDRTIFLWTPQLNLLTQQQLDNTQGLTHPFRIQAKDRHYQCIAIPLKDAGSRSVGHIIVLADDTEEYAYLRKVMLFMAGAMFIAGALIMNLFRIYCRHVKIELENSSINQDPVTLENQKTHRLLLQKKESLNREVQRQQRAMLEEQILSALQRLWLKSTSIEEFLQVSLEKLVSSITWLDHLPQAVIFLVKTKNGSDVLELAGSYNFSPELQRRCAQVQFGRCLCGRAAAGREVVFSDHIDERHEVRFEEMVPHGHYVIPMLRDNALVGVFTLYLPPGAVRNERDESFLKRVADVFTLCIEKPRKTQTTVGDPE